MCDAPHIEPASRLAIRKTLRFLARDSRNPCAALAYWLGVMEPSLEPSFLTPCKSTVR
ncbi:hypothetical protein LMG28614_04143 [Paraburkholderia ultramafica]|uniref:Uncharacterized protein n=1 Tax=Paraburkholderia ultramafica TaxID=1544867 RepID=A0A6S7BLH9_9BURK|nr:hypothetical protein LMG28614_04143 [Paraburkholderia ultramafica]